MPDDPTPRRTTEEQGDVATVARPERRLAPRWAVVLHNDDYTTRDFVVLVLMRFFHLDESRATHIMWNVHYKGQGVAGVFARDIAETKAAQVCAYARAHQFPLRVTAEPE